MYSVFNIFDFKRTVVIILAQGTEGSRKLDVRVPACMCARACMASIVHGDSKRG